MADVPLGVLLSGGLDSSLLASITARLLKKKIKNTFIHYRFRCECLML
jgi:asparagine synthetase B (glutamine-hydrolysing)